MLDKEEVKNSIIAVARQIFSRFGFKKTTMDEIAIASRKGKSSIYYYFESKEDIFQAVVEKEASMLKRELQEAIKQVADPKEKLKVYVLVRMKTLKNLANYYDGASNNEEAMKYYDLSLSRNNKYLLALNNRGIIKGKTGNTRSAIADFEQAIQIKPDYAEAYYNRGVALYQTGDKTAACNDWKQAVSLGFKPAAQAISLYCHEAKAPDFGKIGE